MGRRECRPDLGEGILPSQSASLRGVTSYVTVTLVIKSFRHKGLKTLFVKGFSSKIRAELQRRCIVRLDALDQAEVLHDLDVPGFNFHALRGKPKRCSLHVSGPWCVTFEWIDGDA